MAGGFSVVDASWEFIDPNPDIHQLFSQFNQMFFWGRLDTVYVQWSQRMTLCAGTCKFSRRSQECSIQLSKPLLSYRPRKDLVETLLHEMIHAFLFVADNNRERESHGPKFHEHMWRINKMTGANITVYHSFHDEVDHFKTHWWKCNGPCQHRHPYYGIVKRAMNRAPGPNDFWYKDHQANCGGTFVKIKEPSPKKGKRVGGTNSGGGMKRAKTESGNSQKGDGNENKNKITNYFANPAASTVTSSQIGSMDTQATPSSLNIPDPFSGRGFVLGSIGNSTAPVASSSSSAAAPSSLGNVLGGGSSSVSQPRRGEHPLLAKWNQSYKTSSIPKDTNSTSSSVGRNGGSTKPSTGNREVAESKPEFNILEWIRFDDIPVPNSNSGSNSSSIEVIDLD